MLVTSPSSTNTYTLPNGERPGMSDVSVAITIDAVRFFSRFLVLFGKELNVPKSRGRREQECCHFVPSSLYHLRHNNKAGIAEVSTNAAPSPLTPPHHTPPPSPTPFSIVLGFLSLSVPLWANSAFNPPPPPTSPQSPEISGRASTLLGQIGLHPLPPPPPPPPQHPPCNLLGCLSVPVPFWANSAFNTPPPLSPQQFPGISGRTSTFWANSAFNTTTTTPAPSNSQGFLAVPVPFWASSAFNTPLPALYPQSPESSGRASTILGTTRRFTGHPAPLPPPSPSQDTHKLTPISPTEPYRNADYQNRNGSTRYVTMH